MPRRRSIPAVVFVLFVAAVSAPLRSQGLPALSGISVAYGTQKRTVQPAGELKAQIDALDREIAEARRLGRTGELRRLYAKGLTLLGGGAWTPELEFARSLVLRADRVVVDPSAAWNVRLEQIYAPSMTLERPLLAQATLRRPGAPDVIKAFGTRDGVSRDLRESPLSLSLDLGGLEDGQYQLTVDVLDGTRVLGTAVRPFAIYKGIDATVTRLTRVASTAPEGLRASILYPVDRLMIVNRGEIPLTAFRPAADFADADAIAAAASAGKNPFDGRTGDFTRHYRLDLAGEIMPYRLYVPTTYRAGKPTPVVIALHGLGADQNSFFTGYGGVMPKLAEQYGFIVAAPLGYRGDGWYGWPGGINRADPEALRTIERSEADVMQVLQQVKTLYSVDERRIYLMGHSMGAIGTWHLAQKFPDVWAALGPISGIGDPKSADRIRHLPQFIVHGDADTTVPVSNSRDMVSALKPLGTSLIYVEVAGGTHIDVAAPNLPAMFEFFAKQRK
jgi:predicted esterase